MNLIYTIDIDVSFFPIRKSVRLATAVENGRIVLLILLGRLEGARSIELTIVRLRIVVDTAALDAVVQTVVGAVGETIAQGGWRCVRERSRVRLTERLAGDCVRARAVIGILNAVCALRSGTREKLVANCAGACHACEADGDESELHDV